MHRETGSYQVYSMEDSKDESAPTNSAEAESMGNTQDEDADGDASSSDMAVSQKSTSTHVIKQHCLIPNNLTSKSPIFDAIVEATTCFIMNEFVPLRDFNFCLVDQSKQYIYMPIYLMHVHISHIINIYINLHSHIHSQAISCPATLYCLVTWRISSRSCAYIYML